jgi:hypothetical protein
MENLRENAARPSKTLLKSEWVMTEIRRARKVEREESRRKLFPIRLVDFETIKNWECFDADSGKDLAVELREYYIPDFSKEKFTMSSRLSFRSYFVTSKPQKHAVTGVPYGNRTRGAAEPPMLLFSSFKFLSP